MKATLKVMSDLVKAGRKNPVIRATAAQLVQGLAQKDYLGEIRTLFEFVRDHIRYVRDINETELVHFPEQILQQEYGDCDDKSVLLASLLESIGHPTRFVAVGVKPNPPGTFQHVFVDTSFAKGWLSLETTEPVEMGWRPPGINSIMTWYN